MLPPLLSSKIQTTTSYKSPHRKLTLSQPNTCYHIWGNQNNNLRSDPREEDRLRNMKRLVITCMKLSDIRFSLRPEVLLLIHIIDTCTYHCSGPEFFQELCSCLVSLPRNSARGQPLLDTQECLTFLTFLSSPFSACPSSQVFYNPLSFLQHMILGYSLW